MSSVGVSGSIEAQNTSKEAASGALDITGQKLAITTYNNLIDKIPPKIETSLKKVSEIQ